MAETRSGSGLNIKVKIDASEAIKDLKAVQREAKEVVKSLREVENAKGLSLYSTRELQEELARREGVEEILLSVNGMVIFNHDEYGTGLLERKEVTGPARILINKD